MTNATYDTRFTVEHYYSDEMRHEYRIPMADSIIAATASNLRAVCVTDDPHIQKIREIKTRWIV